MNDSWWSGTALVARRALAEGISARGWRVVTVLMLFGGLAVIVLPRLLGGGPATYTLATDGQPPPSLVEHLDAAARAGDFEIDYVAVDGAAAVESAVRGGDADAGLTSAGPGGTLFVESAGAGPLPSLVAGAVIAQSTADALAAAGLTPDQIAAVQGTPPPEQVPVGPVHDQGRAGVGFAAGIVLYLALILTGTAIATTVATEKSTRVSEVLLAVLRPTQLLVGTVLGVGVLSLIQVAALAVPVGVSLLTSDRVDLPSSAAPDVALAVAWFVLGLCLYAFVFAGLAALVDKVTEVSSALMPVNVALLGSYLLTVLVVVSRPDDWVAVASSLFPLSAPLVMPVRWSSGLVPGWQLLLSMLLTAATAVVLARVASVVYRRGVVRTGRRVPLRAVLAR